MINGARTASFCDTEVAALTHWSEEEKRSLCITIWVDSKNMRVALCPTKEPKKTIYMTPIKVRKAEDVRGNFENLRSALGSQHCQVVFATMSFAGPVSPDHVVVTNWNCEARERVIHFTQLPFDLFPLDRRRFMNDLEAASYGIIARFLRGSLPVIFSPLWKTETSDTISLDGSSLVLSIGSGFGTSFICRVDSSEHNCVVSSEAGHSQAYPCNFNDPEFELDERIIRFASQKLHGGYHQPEWEDFCANRGLELCYQFVIHEKGHTEGEREKIDHIDIEKIRNLALSGDQDALEAFRLHYRFVIRAAQAMVLGIKCQRVFIISETQVKNYPLMASMSASLQKTFNDHPRKHWFNKVNVYVQQSNSTFALSGGLFLSRVFAVSHQKQSHLE